MKTLTFCTWNVYNLIDPRVAPERKVAHRVGELRGRVEEIAGGLVNLGLPDVVSLCEVGSDSILQRLVEALPGGESCWQGRLAAASSGEIGCAMICRREFGLGETMLNHMALQSYPNAPSPGRQYAACFQVSFGTDWLYAIACHWPSDTRGDRESKRGAVADWLGTEIRRLALEDRPMILAGDFNAEPSEDCFLKSTFSAKRFLGEGSTGLYNPTWQLLMPESIGRPKAGSIDLGPSNKLVDGVIVNRALLDGQSIRVHELSLRYGVGGRVSKTSPNGTIGPNRWSPKTKTGCSDHLPLLIDLEVLS